MVSAALPSVPKLMDVLKYAAFTSIYIVHVHTDAHTLRTCPEAFIRWCVVCSCPQHLSKSLCRNASCMLKSCLCLSS